MKILKKCEICGKDKFVFMFKQNDKNFNFPEEFSLCRCTNCGIIFINPQLTSKELEKYYPKEEYYSFNKIVSKEESKEVRLKLFLYNLYFNPKNKNYFLKVIFSPFFLYLRGTIIMGDKKLLDMGCGSGQFLYEMKQFGMKVWGIELGEIKKEYLKEFNIKSSLKEAKYPSDFFDLITMNHVLHHMHNPSETVSELNRILKKNGVFILGISNYGSFAHSLFKKDWYQYDTPRHLFNFSNKILVNLLEKNGFKIKKIRFNSRPEQFVNSFYYKKNLKKRSGIIYNFLKVIFWPLTIVVDALKMGDQVEIYCTK